MLTDMSKLSKSLRDARRAAGLSQAALAARAGVSRMTLQKLEAGDVDPRISTWTVLMRALGLEVVLVPTSLQPAALDFIRSGGRIVGQAEGISAPASIVSVLTGLGPERPAHATKVRR
jgi:DNA-binding XRE family transcriptional regulator